MSLSYILMLVAVLTFTSTTECKPRFTFYEFPAGVDREDFSSDESDHTFAELEELHPAIDMNDQYLESDNDDTNDNNVESTNPSEINGKVVGVESVKSRADQDSDDLNKLNDTEAKIKIEAPKSRSRRNARVCKWIGGHTGWHCDDPVSRWTWRTIQRVRGVTDCNSFCIKQGRRGGRCRGANNYDRSTWCPAGQTCSCF